MPSDFEPIAKTECVGCGRGPDHVALKRLNTYSRAFGCLGCYLKYSICANCHHEKHASLHFVTVLTPYLRDQGRVCFCGCDEYRHGLEAEFDRQFSEHTGKAPTQRACLRGCGAYVTQQVHGRLPLFCPRCDKEWAELGG